MRQLRMDDYSKGMIITGLGQRSCNRSVVNIEGVVTVHQTDDSYMGDLYRIESVDLPMMVIRLLCSRGGRKAVEGIYTRNDLPFAVNLQMYNNWAEPSAEYVNALCPGLEIPQKETIEGL